MVRLDVTKSPELLATIYALRAIDKTIAAQVRKYTKAIATPEWLEAIRRRADSKLEHRVMSATATVAVSNQNVRVTSANKGRPLSGGLSPKTGWAGVEFGMNAQGSTYKRTSPKGKPHTVRRVTGTQFKPRNPEGYVFWPAAKEMVPRIASLWVQTTVKTIANALEGKRE